VGLTPLQKDPSKYSRVDRLLFYVGFVVLVIAVAVVLRQFPLNIPILNERRVLVFTQWWQNELDAGVLPSLIQEFEAKNPGVKISLDTRSYHEVRRLLLPEERDAPAAKTAKLPDILGLDSRWLPGIIEREALDSGVVVREKNAVLRTEEEEARNAVPGALPILSCVIPLFYRIDLLQEAGFDRPPKTLDEFAAIAQAITDRPRGRYGFALSLSPEDPLGVYRDVLPWFRSTGADLLHNGRPAFTETQAANALYFLNGLSQDGLLAPESFVKTNKDRIEDFIAGRLAMMLAPAVEIKNIRAAGIPFGVTTIPSHAAYIGKPAAGVIGWYAGVSRSSRHKDEARAFLTFLAENAGDIAEKTGMVPGTGVIPETLMDPSKKEQDALYLKVKDIYAAANTTEGYLSLPEEMALEIILGEELRGMLEEGRSPDETARAVQERWEAAL
jgi:multiple sugar transport system substrate-binding protein